MKSEVQMFVHEEFGKVRVFLVGGEIRYALKDVCKMLGLNRFDVWDMIDAAGTGSVYRVTRGCTNTAALIITADGLDQLVTVSSHPRREEMRGWLRDVGRRVKSRTADIVQHFRVPRMYKVRVVMHERGVWFIAQDVCNVLGLFGDRVEMMDSIPDEDKAFVETDDNGVPVKLSVVNVKGLRVLEDLGKTI